jgi:predicted nuclease of predicted toxin-antitoxin system
LIRGCPATAAAILRDDGWDAVHTREIGMSEAADGEILDYAARESRVVVTLDRDFPQILALTATARPSIVLIRQQRLRAAELAALMASIWREHENALEQGCVLKVGARGTRVRRLPLR